MKAMVTAQDLWATVRAFWPARILLTAVELDLFTIIGDAPKSAADVAEGANADPRATEMLLNALVAMGYLDKRGGKYKNGDLAKRYLVKDSPDYMGGPLGHANYLWMTWSHLTQVAKTGVPAEVEAPPEATEWFIMAMHAFAKETAATVASRLDFSSVKTMLDLGGGPGTYAIEFARQNPGLTAVVFDRVDVVPIADRIIAAAQMAERVKTMPGDFLHDDIGSGYDLAFISAIIHSYGPEDNRLILRKTRRALNPGGQVVIRDFIMDESKTNPPSAALFAINMLVNTDRGTTYSESEVRQWLTECGFAEVTRKDLDSDTSLLIARSPY